MEQIGITKDNKAVMNGIFYMYASSGIPLTVIFHTLKENDMIPCWPTFYQDAISNNWKNETIKSRLREAIVDVWGIEFYTEWKKRFDLIVK